MNCPVCDGIRMREVEKDGVMIDICPQCKGVWLDRGELDKLMGGVREIREEFNQWHNERHREPGGAQYGSQSSSSGQNNTHPGGYSPNPGSLGGNQGNYSRPAQYGSQSGHGQYKDPYYGKKKKKNFLDQLGELFD
ncbi:TFIIB-type zinc ribbon-containing protein [Paenibacillus tarimensis]|uniref:TFIIB-type zinc ribbon-containing protein n=1 Tax=Paenibacillus tarimensis TaxID=416012 RepID=UPI001F21D44B|nr:zf-TFIIB domain-containing protein [Paenibacillus tarimensis]MCF2944900.1 zf-TFIIB domain-containing protein [Paenibacillus tarimensis]